MCDILVLYKIQKIKYYNLRTKNYELSHKKLWIIAQKIMNYHTKNVELSNSSTHVIVWEEAGGIESCGGIEPSSLILSVYL